MMMAITAAVVVAAAPPAESAAASAKISMIPIMNPTTPTKRGRTASTAGRGLAWVELLVHDANALDELRTRLDAAEVGFDADGSGVRVRNSDGIELRVRTQT